MTMPQCYGNMDSYEPKSSADQPVKEENMLDQQKNYDSVLPPQQ